MYHTLLVPLDGSAFSERALPMATRAGLHCAPQAHRVAGTLDQGALRFSPGYFTTADDIRFAAGALRQVVAA